MPARSNPAAGGPTARPRSAAMAHPFIPAFQQSSFATFATC
jgi:hypothetical protein